MRMQRTSELLFVSIFRIIYCHTYNIIFSFRCYEYDINTFDPFLNMKRFHECIFKIVKILLEDELTNDLCAEMVSLLIVANLGDYSVLQQTLPFLVKKSVFLVLKFSG